MRGGRGGLPPAHAAQGHPEPRGHERGCHRHWTCSRVRHRATHLNNGGCWELAERPGFSMSSSLGRRRLVVVAWSSSLGRRRLVVGYQGKLEIILTTIRVGHLE
jgi:hypothetical protein